MSFLSQLLPGFRHVRAPLFSGYLWLFVAWLLFADDLPKKHESAVYADVFELGHAIGPVGLAVVASVAAYLVGSLVQVGLASLGDLLSRLKRNRGRRTWYAALERTITHRDLRSGPLFAPTDIDWFDGDEETRSRLNDLAHLKLASSRDALLAAVAGAEEEVSVSLGEISSAERMEVEVGFEADFKVGSVPVVKSFVVQGPEGRETAPCPEQPELPNFSAARDLFEERGTIKTLLMETTQQAGAEVERLYSEAELRFAVALPLATAIIVLAVKSHSLVWLTLLAAPVGLLLHAMVLNKHGGLEMVEALRSRDSDELEKITPVFNRYEKQAGGLAGEIERFNWGLLAKVLQQKEQHPPAEVLGGR